MKNLGACHEFLGISRRKLPYKNEVRQPRVIYEKISHLCFYGIYANQILTQPVLPIRDMNEVRSNDCPLSDLIEWYF